VACLKVLALLFKNSHGIEINEFAQKGSRGELDLLIGDVVNKIGGLSPDVTAVNFGQAKKFSSGYHGEYCGIIMQYGR